MKNRFLVTGSNGFIGFALVKALLKDSNNLVFGVDNFTRYSKDSEYEKLNEYPNFRGIEFDLTDDLQTRNLPDVDVVFHFAALNGTNNFYKIPVNVIKSGILPTLNIIERYKNDQLTKILFSGTSESYAGAVEMFNYKVPTPEKVPLVISDIFNPRWSYAASKTLSEVAIASAGIQYGMNYSIVRFHNVYGPRMGNSHVIPQLFERFIQLDFKVYGCQATRSFIHIDDAVAASVLIALNKDTSKEIYNVGTQDEVKILELAQLIQKVLGLNGEIDCLPAPLGSVSRRCPDTTKLNSLGFSPKVKLVQGLKDFSEAIQV